MKDNFRSAPRFYQPDLPTGGMVELVEAEARHARSVLRATIGDPVILFDGCRGEALARIEHVDRRVVRAEILQRCDTNRELPFALELLVALPKGDRQKTLVDGLVQLGVSKLTPLICQRGVAQPNSGALDRLRRAVIESSKQCGRNQLMHIGEPLELPQAATAEAPASHPALLLFAHPYECQSTWLNCGKSVANEGTARIAIGPEGGFSEPEVQIWREAQWSQISLGPRILRVEIAALSVAAWWSNH